MILVTLVVVVMAMAVVMEALSEVSVVIVVSVVMTMVVLVQNIDVNVVFLLRLVVASINPEALVVGGGVPVATGVLAVQVAFLAVTVKIVVNLAMMLGLLSQVVFFLLGIGLHLEDKVSCLNRYVFRVENAGVGIESTVGLVPALSVKSVEIIAPVELKFVRVMVVLEDLNVVVEDVPGHVGGVEALAP